MVTIAMVAAHLNQVTILAIFFKHLTIRIVIEDLNFSMMACCTTGLSYFEEGLSIAGVVVLDGPAAVSDAAL